MILNKILKKELHKKGFINGYKFNNQFQVLSNNYKQYFLIDAVIATQDTFLITTDMVLDEKCKDHLKSISNINKTILYVIDYYDWFREDLNIEQKIKKAIWCTNEAQNKLKLN